ncbi:MAG: GNAT family N-acetyltransferase, partial [Rhizobiales bacterium]|nr:GNAT family N-acetyltransferase [Hyphomicrobiales bacterium]
MVTIRAEIPADVTAREALLDRAFGRMRNRKT